MYEERRQPTVRVLWDPMPDIEGCDEAEESDQTLLPSKWNKDVSGAWRFDVDIDLAVTEDWEIDIPYNTTDNNEGSESESESEGETESGDSDSD